MSEASKTVVLAAGSQASVLGAFLLIGPRDLLADRRVHDRGRRCDLRAELAAAAMDQPLIGGNQGDVGIDPDPAVAREHLDVEMQMPAGAVGMVEIVRDHADLLA